MDAKCVGMLAHRFPLKATTMAPAGPTCFTPKVWTGLQSQKENSDGGHYTSFAGVATVPTEMDVHHLYATLQEGDRQQAKQLQRAPQKEFLAAQPCNNCGASHRSGAQTDGVPIPPPAGLASFLQLLRLPCGGQGKRFAHKMFGATAHPEVFADQVHSARPAPSDKGPAGQTQADTGYRRPSFSSVGNDTRRRRTSETWHSTGG